MAARAKKTFSLDDWIELDLTQAAAEGKLLPVFGLESTIRQVEDVLVAEGNRTPVLVGPAGVGKTAIVHGIVQNSLAGKGPQCFRGVKFVQVGLRSIASHFKESSDGTDTFQEIVTAIVKSPQPLVPFVRDIHLAWRLDWESVLLRLCSALGRPLLAEGSLREVNMLMEFSPDLAEWLVPIPIDEPSATQTRRIVGEWAEHQRSRTGRVISPAAQRRAIELTGRFIGNRHFPRKALDLLREARDLSPGPEVVGLGEVIARFSQTTRVPQALIDPAVFLDLDQTRTFIAERLLGQDEAIEAVVRVVALIKAGLSDPRRPFGVFLFVGPTGVGKTHTAQLLADYFFGDRGRMIRVNLSDFGNEAGHGQLFGIPGASNVEVRRGVLAQRLGNAPFGVLLLDELEKAHSSVHDGLLELVDEGRYTNGNHETVSVRSLIVIATSNAGAEVYRQTGVGFAEDRDLAKLDVELDRRLLQTFRFEFLNRFDRVVHFHPLSRATIRKIAQRELQALTEREGFATREIVVEVEADVLDWLVAHGYHPHFGARFLRRELERSIVGPLAAFVVAQRVQDHETVVLGVRGGRIDVRRPPEPVTASPAPLAVPDADVSLALAKWEHLLAAHDDRRREAEALLEASAAPNFWTEPATAHELLGRYRALDVRLAAEVRLFSAHRRLAALPTSAPAELVHAALLEAEAARRRFEALDESADENGAFVLIGPAEVTGHVSEAWLTELHAIELAWFRRQGFDPQVVAEELAGERVVGVVFEVDGPGMAAALKMEEGSHRRRLKEGEIERLTVEVLPRRPARAHCVLADARRVVGTFVPQIQARMSVELASRGFTRSFRGSDRDTLGLLAAALAATKAVPVEPARLYHFDGVAVRDPRTAAYIVAPRELKKGALEPLRRAWDLRGVDKR